MVKSILAILGLLLALSLSSAQTYQLGNDVLDDGGRKMTSSGYVLRGGFGQPTIGRIEGGGYKAIIGFWHPPYAPGPGVEEDLLVLSPVPIVFSLSQNYPNPFGQFTIINYQLPKPTRTALRIYDLSGRVVRTLVDEKQEPGYYRVTWDLREVSGEYLPNGVYFYRIQAGDFISTKKLVALR